MTCANRATSKKYHNRTKPETSRLSPVSMLGGRGSLFTCLKREFGLILLDGRSQFDVGDCVRERLSDRYMPSYDWGPATRH
jgi:hypothetical protein